MDVAEPAPAQALHIKLLEEPNPGSDEDRVHHAKGGRPPLG